MKKRTKNIITFTIFLGIIALWIYLFSIINVQKLIVQIGVANGYAILFLFGAIGGASVLGSPSYFLVLTNLSIGGFSPILLGIVGGLGLTIGNTVVFLIGVATGKKAPEKFQKILIKLEKKIEKKPNWFINLSLYIYIGFTPLPNEVAIISLGLLEVKKKTIIFILLLGNITSGILGSLLIHYGVNVLNIVH